MGRVAGPALAGVLALMAAGDPRPGTAATASPAVQHASGGPAASTGDLRFHASAVAYRHGSDEARAEFSIRIPYRQMRFVPTEDRFSARLQITALMKNAQGKKSGYLQREAVVQSLDLGATVDSLLGEIYSLGIVVPPGRYTYRITVEDQNAARQGLVSKMKKQRRQGVVEGSIDLGSWLFRDPALSGLQFAWEVRERTGRTDFTKGPYEVLPQPSAYFGNYQETAHAYYEIYDAPPPPGGRTYHLASRVTNAAGDTVLATADTVRVTEGTAWPHRFLADASVLQAGHYALSVSLRDAAEGRAAETGGEFDVIWSPESWIDDAADVYDVTAETLFTSDSAEVFRRLPMGEKERWIERVWRAADPTPESAENESRTEFRRRVAYAQTHYSVIGLGMYSDRGRVYIRYGEPDDIKIERIPVGSKTLGYALGPEIPSSSKSGITDSQAGTADMRAYEIWTYQHRGRELVPRYGTSEVASGLKFVFVDDQGYGEYRLEYSSTTGIH